MNANDLDLLRDLNQAHLFFKVAPHLAVVNHAVDPRPKLRVHRIVKFALPPKMQWQIGIQMRKHNARQKIGARSFEEKRKLFAFLR